MSMSTLQNILSFRFNYPRFTILIILLVAYSAKVIVFDETNPDRFWNKGDALFYHFMTQSLLEDGDLDLSNNHGILALNEGHFAQSQHGYPTAKQSPFMSVAVIPFVKVFGPVGALWFNLLCSIGIVLLLYQLCRTWVNSNSALIASLYVALASVLFRYAFNFSPDVFSCLLLLALLLAAFRKWWWLVGLFAGLAITAKVGNLITVAPIFAYILWSNKSQIDLLASTLFKTGSLFTLSLLPFGLYNEWMFGSPFTTGYQSILTSDADGIATVISHTDDFNTHFFQGLWNLLLNTDNGIVIDNIFVVPFVIAGIFFLPKKSPSKSLFIAIIVVIQIGFYATYDYQLATRLGNRFLLFSIALSALPISWMVQAFLDGFLDMQSDDKSDYDRFDFRKLYL